MATKIDLVKEDKTYYTAKPNPQIVDFPEIFYLAVKGKGEPAGKLFTEAVQSLYPLAYGIKGICKKDGRDFAVAKLEGLWWVKSNKPALEVPRQEWYWKLLIRLPDFVSSEIVEKVRLEVIKKKDIALIKDIKFEIYLHKTADGEKAKKYWSKIAGLSLVRFQKIIWKKNKIRTRRKNRGEGYYGLLRMRVLKSTNFNRKISGWIEGIVRNIGE